MKDLPDSVRAMIDDDHAPTCPLSDFRFVYEKLDDNVWWMVSSGHHLNLFDAACERIDELERLLERLLAIRQPEDGENDGN